MANFCASGVLALGAKLGPMLWQLPPNLSFDPEAVAAFLALLPRTTSAAATLGAESTLDEDRTFLSPAVDAPLRHAVEVRNTTFDVPEFTAIARDAGVAIVVADTAGRYPVIRETTADFQYLRLHGDEELYASGYTPDALDRWAEDIRTWLHAGQDVYAYFDNDLKVRSPVDATSLRTRLAP
ncbi:hypothetical protein GCM10027406_17470 [Leifsonia lichenia]